MSDRKCSLCGQVKGLEEFYLKSGGPGGRESACRDCKRLYTRTRYRTRYRRRPVLPEGHKLCRACNRVLPLSDFQKNAGRRDGVQVYCLGCWPKYMRRWRATPAGADAEMAKTKRLRRTPEWRERNRMKNYARVFTQLAVRFGYLTLEPCRVCGGTERVEAHHTQYERPLDGIEWFCQPHHLAAHGGRFN